MSILDLFKIGGSQQSCFQLIQRFGNCVLLQKLQQRIKPFWVMFHSFQQGSVAGHFEAMAQHVLAFINGYEMLHLKRENKCRGIQNRVKLESIIS